MVDASVWACMALFSYTVFVFTAVPAAIWVGRELYEMSQYRDTKCLVDEVNVTKQDFFYYGSCAPFVTENIIKEVSVTYLGTDNLKRVRQRLCSNAQECFRATGNDCTYMECWKSKQKFACNRYVYVEELLTENDREYFLKDIKVGDEIDCQVNIKNPNLVTQHIPYDGPWSAKWLVITSATFLVMAIFCCIGYCVTDDGW